MADLTDTGWHLDKRVPITILMAISAQAVGAVWWASRIDARLERLEASQVSQTQRDDAQDRAVADSAGRLVQRLDRIDDKLDRLIERQVIGEKRK
jgi:hypothetical protein